MPTYPIGQNATIGLLDTDDTGD